MKARLWKIDELTRPDHTFLAPDDECYYLGEYTARRGFAFSEMNNLINNLRKPMDRKGRPEWKHKEAAIVTSARMLREAINEEWLEAVTLVPIPSSRLRTDIDYDDRLPRILHAISSRTRLDIRELVVMARRVGQSHLQEDRIPFDELLASMTVDDHLANPLPAAIAVFDGVLTTGRHFKAVQAVLRRRFPDVPIVGMFVARRAPQSAPPDQQ